MGFWQFSFLSFAKLCFVRSFYFCLDYSFNSTVLSYLIVLATKMLLIIQSKQLQTPDIVTAQTSGIQLLWWSEQEDPFFDGTQ